MEGKKAWTADLERILWNQAAHSRGQKSNTRAHFDFPNGPKEVTGLKRKFFRAAFAGEGVHGNGPQTLHGHSSQ